MAYDLVQYKWDNVWEANPSRYGGDVIAFNQQYYQYYLGGQLRTDLLLGSLPVHLTLPPLAQRALGDGLDVDQRRSRLVRSDLAHRLRSHHLVVIVGA